MRPDPGASVPAVMSARLDLGPFGALAVIAALAAAALAGLDEAALAWTLAAATGLAALANPRNGLWLTLLACPFFLGEPQDPYVFVINALAGLTIIAWLAHLVLARRLPSSPGLWLIVLLAGLILADIPLNLKEAVAALANLDGVHAWRLVVEGRKFHDLFALRSVILHIGGLAFLVCCLDLIRPRDLAPLGLCLLLIGVALSAVSLALYLGWLPARRPYLSLNLAGTVFRHGQELLASTAFNRQYLNELLVPLTAVAGWAAARSQGLRRWSALAGLAVMLAVMAATGQRTPVICLTAMALFAAGLIAWRLGRRGVIRAAWLVAAAAAAIVAVLAVDAALLQGHLAGRFLGLGGADAVAGIGTRPLVWRVAAEMIAAHPLTGLGPGVFRLLARPFAEAAGLGWQPDLVGVLGTAHSSPVHWAAELGLPIVLGFIILAVRLIRPALAAYSLGVWRAEAATLFTALTGLICFGLFQHITYLSAMALPLMAGLAGCARLGEVDPPRLPGRKAIIIGLVLMAAMTGLKAQAIITTPFRSEWRVGFSDLGVQPDGRQAWWTTGRKAVWTIPVRRPILVTQIRLYHPIVLGKPQTVTFKVDGRVIRQRTLWDMDWHEIRLDLSDWVGTEARLTIEVGYTFRPYTIDRNNPDRRHLGVMIKDIRFAHREGG